MGKVMEQIDRAGQGRDTNALKTLGAKANGLAQQLGPDYVRIMDGLNHVDPNSAEKSALILYSSQSSDNVTKADAHCHDHGADAARPHR